MACGADAQGTKLYLECRLKEWSPYRQDGAQMGEMVEDMEEGRKGRGKA